MKTFAMSTRYWILLCLLLCPAMFPEFCHAAPLAGGLDLAKADSLFRAGKFAESKKIYSRILENDPAHYRAVLSLGKLSLFGNSLAEAENYLERAIELDPADEEPKALLGEVCCRRDDFKRAAGLFREVGKTAKADRFEYISREEPYRIESEKDRTEIEFHRTDPLPIVKLKINGSEEALFIIDTGGWELILDSDFAEEIGAKRFGEETATFAGGMKAKTYPGAVDKVEIGDFVVHNVPVYINDGQKGMAAMLGEPIRGVLGTVFLYHFIFTFDYPEGKLILHRKTEENRKEMERCLRSSEYISSPFWMSGDHIMVSWGTVNGSQPMLFFVDTGMAGGGFTGTEKTVKEANIQLPEESMEGIGGGGRVQIKRAVIDELTLGDAVEKDVVGLFGAVPPGFEEKNGYLIGGIISHGFFRPYELTFDFTSMNLIMKRKGDTVH